MFGTGSSIKANIIYGLLFLVPLAVVILAVEKLTKILSAFAEPFGLRGAFAGLVVIFIVLVFALVIAYVVGAFVRTRVGKWSFQKVEKVVLEQVPGYQIVDKVLKGFLNEQTAYPAVTVDLYGPGISAFGLIMDELEDGRLIIFLPSSPALTVGNVMVVDPDRVTRLDSGAKDIAQFLSQWGVGAHEVMDGVKS